MNKLEIITIDLQPEEIKPSEKPCEVLLREILETLPYPPIESEQPTDSDSESKPYEVRFALNPKAWGNFPKTQPITLLIPRAKSVMHLALRNEADAAYVLGGWFLIDHLAQGVFGLEQFHSHRLSMPRGPGGGQQLVDELRKHVSEDRTELFMAFEVVRDELAAKESRCLALLQSYAVCRAVHEELPRLEALAIEEARRYLSLEKTDDTSIRAALANDHASHVQALTGPEGRDLVRAIRSLAGPYQKLKAARQHFEANLPQRRELTSAIWLAWLGPLNLPVLAANAAGVLGPTKSERQTAASQLIQASAEFQGRFTELATRYPILFKIADSVDQDEAIWRRDTVLALQGALEASAELTEVLSEDPAKVWRFPGLIERSIQKGFAAEFSFASRAASDKLMKENDMPVFARLNAGFQLFSTTLTLVPFPPVKLAIAIVSVIADAAELQESYFRTKEQRLGFRAAIDPGLALGPDASYASSVIQAAFVALGLLPIPGAVKEWAEEGAKAARDANLRRALLEQLQ